MKEVDAAVLLRRRRASLSAMLVAAARSRFACGSAFASEKAKRESDGTEEVAAERRSEIYGLRKIAVADQLRARSPRQFPRKKETAPHDLACGYGLLRWPQRIRLPR